MKICVPQARPRLSVLNPTPASLLEQVRRGGDQQAWERFVRLYTPLLYSWARRVGLQEQDAADLVQEVFALLVQKLPQFAYDRHQSFRAYLHTITLNKWREHYRRRAALPLQAGAVEIPDPAGPDSTALFDETEYQQYLIGRVLQLVQAEFQLTTWKACWEHVVSGRSAAEVAAELGISEGAVYVAKHRVLRRLRQELEGLLD